MNENAVENALQAALRHLPAVDHLLKQPAIATLLDEFPRTELLNAIRAVLDDRRAQILQGKTPSVDVPVLALDVRQKLYQRARPNLRRVINATGIVLHTGLGRAPLAQEAIDAINEVAAGYSNLELNLETGQRGDRHEHARALLKELTGAEDGLVVNNNAAATFLALNTLSAGREAVISRGELVEIGGSYRMPDIMAAAGCKMVEVGTTNRTRIADYERAITADTALLVRAHTSNYRIQGFTESAALSELVELARKHNLLIVDDLGSGLLAADVPWPAETGGGAAAPPAAWDEPSVRDSLAAGADLTFFSGDKLLGGPQAGIIVGRADLMARLRKNPLMRTFRPDKLTLAALEATLRLYRDPESLHRRLPILKMLAAPPEKLEETARRIARQIAEALPQADVRCENDQSYAGGGSLPTLAFPTQIVRVRIPEVASAHLAAALRQRDVPILGRLRDEALIFDCRTLSEDDAEQIAPALAEAVRENG